MSDIIKELKKEREFFSVNNQHIIDHIYDLCIKHIKFLNSMGNTNYIYQVPLLLVGFPVYDINIISVAVYKKLKTKGFETLLMEKNRIYISWKK